jgi:hypothetical protein
MFRTHPLCSRIARGTCAVLVLMLLAAPAHAHKPSDAYLALRVDGASVNGRWDIALRDLDYALALDADSNRQLTWGEVRRRGAEIDRYAVDRLAIRADGQSCPITVGGHQVDTHIDGAYLVLAIAATCPSAITTLDLDYEFLFDIDTQHRGLLTLATATARTAIFTAESRRQRIEVAGGASSWATFTSFMRNGIEHIWSGYDHLAFLLTLLLPAVLLRRAGRWLPRPALGDSLLEALKVATAFTIAHSLTLSLAALGIVRLPSRLTESAIALSVVLAAVANLHPRLDARRWTMAFGFGLVHGFGFASVLADLALPQGSRLLSLLGFNVGVEIGQVAVVAVFLPVAYGLRGAPFYRHAVLTGGSCAIAALAAVWFVERSLGLAILTIR